MSDDPHDDYLVICNALNETIIDLAAPKSMDPMSVAMGVGTCLRDVAVLLLGCGHHDCARALMHTIVDGMCSLAEEEEAAAAEEEDPDEPQPRGVTQ
jgi:hypothetical protein